MGINQTRATPPRIARARFLVKLASSPTLLLPARFRHPGYHPLVRQLAERNSRHVKAAQVPAPTSCQLTAVHHASRRCVTRQHRQSNVVPFCLQLGALLRIAISSRLLLIVSFDPTFFCHNEIVCGGLYYIPPYLSMFFFRFGKKS